MQTHNGYVFFLMAFSKGWLQKDEQKRLVNSLWVWNTNTLRKHLWFVVHPSVNLTFSVIFIFPFPGQTRKGTDTPCPEDLSSYPIAKQHLFLKALNTCVYSHGFILCPGVEGQGPASFLLCRNCCCEELMRGILIGDWWVVWVGTRIAQAPRGRWTTLHSEVRRSC